MSINEGSFHSSGPRLHTSMPVLEDGLSSGHASDLEDASFLGKLLVLPVNVRLDWKVFVRCKHSSLFGLVISNKEKKVYNIGSRS